MHVLETDTTICATFNCINKFAENEKSLSSSDAITFTSDYEIWKIFSLATTTAASSSFYGTSGHSRCFNLNCLHHLLHSQLTPPTHICIRTNTKPQDARWRVDKFVSLTSTVREDIVNLSDWIMVEKKGPEFRSNIDIIICRQHTSAGDQPIGTLPDNITASINSMSH